VQNDTYLSDDNDTNAITKKEDTVSSPIVTSGALLKVSFEASLTHLAKLHLYYIRLLISLVQLRKYFFQVMCLNHDRAYHSDR